MFPILISILNDDEQLYASFKSEAEPHMNALYNFAISLTTDRDDAYDLVQDTYIKAFRFFDKFEKGTNCKAWLFRIMKNTYINDYRKRSKQPEKVDYNDIENFYEEIKASFVNNNHLEDEFFKNLLGDEITEAIASLSEDFRTVTVLCDLEGFSYEEIAEITNAPIGTVRSRLHRARKILFAKLYKYASNKGYTEKK
ncbi:MAG: sigma-70 family RNA polymerase sigma factor [Bacteroidetes bacterium]|nr:sigma-70 family RNA polymerase sigma factor [Bacteroidota bacterium]MCH8941240.1 sigma-70 family RNA polymerase sigma factor [Bacteroidota bacterium]